MAQCTELAMRLSFAIGLVNERFLRSMSAQMSPAFLIRAGMFLSVKVVGSTLPVSISSQVHGADTGAPRLARTV